MEPTTDFITADILSKPEEIVEIKPSKQELTIAIAELTDIKHSIQCLSDNAGAGYRFASRMADKSYVNMRERDLGFMRGYWLGLEAALKEVMDFLNDREGLRQELYGKKQENENAGD